jgi:hypothetical protein
MANQLQGANSQHFEGLQLEGAKWLGKPEGRSSAPLKVTVTDVELANKLINNRLVLNYEIFSVTKFVAAKRRGKVRSPLFHVKPTPCLELVLAETVALPEPQADQTQAEASKGRKRPAPEALSEKERIAGRGRGRPSNAIKFTSQQREGQNPFQISLERSQGKKTSQPSIEDTEMESDIEKL